MHTSFVHLHIHKPFENPDGYEFHRGEASWMRNLFPLLLLVFDGLNLLAGIRHHELDA